MPNLLKHFASEYLICIANIEYCKDLDFSFFIKKEEVSYLRELFNYFLQIWKLNLPKRYDYE